MKTCEDKDYDHYTIIYNEYVNSISTKIKRLEIMNINRFNSKF